MPVKARIEGLARLAARRPALAIAIVLALALGGGVLALGLRPSAGADTFVSGSSAAYKATEDDYRHFGGDPVVILIREPLPNLVETNDLQTVSELEACLAGQRLVAGASSFSFVPAPAGSPPYGGYSSPCGRLMRSRPVQAVYGPGTFLNRAVAAVNNEYATLLQAARTAVTQASGSAYRLALAKGMSRKQALAAASAAGGLESQQQASQLYQLYLQSGIQGVPRIDDSQFISQIVFDSSRGANEPKARFAYLFPTANSALIQVRLKAGLSDAQQTQAITWIRDAARMPMFASAHGGTYTVTGEPVVENDLASEISGSIAGLLVAAVLVMAATLLIVFRSRLRLLPLAIALAAAGITFGAVALFGATLTMASIAVLPILIGLAVDYAIQFQSRVQEARGGDGAVQAVARAAAGGVPAIATAALATATGFLVLLLSPIPMVRSFGLLLVVGIAVAFLCALVAGSAAIVLADRDGGVLGASLRGAADILADARRHAARLRPRVRVSAAPSGALTRVSAARPGVLARARPGALARRTLAIVAARPGRVLLAGLVLAVLGWVADTQTPVQSDVTKLVPATMPALRDLRTLERVTGVSGEIDVTVRAANVNSVNTVRWMSDYQQALLSHYGYRESNGCARATLCPALSLPDLFSSGAGTTPALTQGSIHSLLAAVPPYFSQAVITPDHREATLAFGIRLMPLARQQQVIDYMSSQLHPPGGVTARLTGLPVLAARANSALSSSSRRLLTLLAGLAAVGLVLLAVFRRVERALVPLLPIALATGWSALILFLIGIPLNPMSAALGALVIAISTEFSVLLSERFRHERAAGHDLDGALARTYRSTGAAVLASGVTAIAGFGVLVFSDITMLRDFGFVTVIDLTVSLAGVLLILPAALALAGRERSARSDLALVLGGRAWPPRPRRRLRRQRVA